MLPRLLALVALSPIAFTLIPIANGGCDTTCGLSEHNRNVLHEYIVNNNAAPLVDSAIDSFFVVTPGGIETRDHVIRSNANLDVSSAEIFTHRIEVVGDTAVLAGKIVAVGTLEGEPMPQLGFLTVYTMIEGEWHLLARSLVPQFGRGLAQGTVQPSE